MNRYSVVMLFALTGCAVVAPGASNRNQPQPTGASIEPGEDQSGVDLSIVLARAQSSTTPTGSTGDTGGTGTTTPPTGPLETFDRAGNTVTLDVVSAVVRHIELDLPSGQTCDDLSATFTFDPPVECQSGEDKIEIVGPFTVDLVSQTSMPSLDALTIPPLTYERVDVRLHDSSAPDGITLTFSGSVDLDGSVLTFDAALGINEDVRFEAPAGIPVDGNTSIVAMLDADTVFGQTGLGACAAALADDADHAVIDAESECGDELEDDLEDALKESFDLD